MWFWHRHSDLFGVKQVLDPHPPSAFIVSVLHDSPPYCWYSKVLVVVPVPALIQAQLNQSSYAPRQSPGEAGPHESVRQTEGHKPKGSELTVSAAECYSV